MQSLKDRLKNLDRKAQEGGKTAEALADAVEELQKRLDKLDHQFPMVCVKVTCPWDTAGGSRSNNSAHCPIGDETISAPRTPEFGCRCEQFEFAK